VGLGVAHCSQRKYLNKNEFAENQSKEKYSNLEYGSSIAVNGV
jgi:hypothetical protein